MQSLSDPSCHALLSRIYLEKIRNDNGLQNIIPNMPLHNPDEFAASTPRASLLEIPKLRSCRASIACYKWSNGQNCPQVFLGHTLESSIS